MENQSANKTPKTWRKIIYFIEGIFIFLFSWFFITMLFAGAFSLSAFYSIRRPLGNDSDCRNLLLSQQ